MAAQTEPEYYARVTRVPRMFILMTIFVGNNIRNITPGHVTPQYDQSIIQFPVKKINIKD